MDEEPVRKLTRERYKREETQMHPLKKTGKAHHQRSRVTQKLNRKDGRTELCVWPKQVL